MIHYPEWLALHVLNEQQLVSYRSLSRALKVHSNLAKQMLYEFYSNQNAKKPGTVHATYLITGIKRKEVPTTNGTPSQQDGEDAVMQSSPPVPLPSSSARKPADHDEEPTLVQTVMLVKEEHLSQAMASFESFTGIHIYSLQAKGLSDIQSLTECNRQIAADCASEDPLETWKQYGTIQNPNVKRRTQRRQPSPLAPVAKDAPAKPKPLAPTTKPTTLKKEASKDSQDSKAASKPPSTKATPEPAKKPIAPKRQSSDIFKSFAKGKTKAKAQESQESAGSVPKAEPEYETTGGFSDEEDADEDARDVEVTSNVPDGKCKKDREAELQAMMDQEDEVMEDAAEAEPDIADAHADDGAIDKPDLQTAEEPQDTVKVENGRRHGRRRVLKKKTVKDEDGYLVTKEEAAWESFSEEEPAPKRIKVPPTTSMNKPAVAAGKKGVKPQGNIMSFFSKK